MTHPSSALSTQPQQQQQQQQQQQALAMAMAMGRTQTPTPPPPAGLQQRAAAAAQYLNTSGGSGGPGTGTGPASTSAGGAQRKPTSRDVQLMLEKNETALRAWSYLHAQQPPKQRAAEHKAWIHKCLALRQQVGTRLEVLASLADKQIALEDAGDRAKAPPPKPKQPSSRASRAKAPKTPPRPKTATTQQQQQQQQHQQSQAPLATSAAATVTSIGATSNSTIVSGPMATTAPALGPQGNANGGGLGDSANASSLYFPNANATSAPPGAPAAAAAAAAASLAMGQPPPSSFAMASAPQSYQNAAYVPTSAYMNQSNYLLGGGAGGSSAAMMNPQFLGMANPMAMAMPPGAGATSAAMFNANMFNYAAMGHPTQLPSDPFNASFQMPGPASAAASAAFNPVFTMTSAAMVNPMGAYGGLPTPQQQQQQQQQQMLMNSMAFGMAPQAPGPYSLPQQPTTVTSTTGTTAGGAVFADSDNLFDGLSEDAFLNMQ